jgi:hypothetical protein
MQVRIGRLWRLRRGWAGTNGSAGATVSPPLDAPSTPFGGTVDGLALSGSAPRGDAQRGHTQHSAAQHDDAQRSPTEHGSAPPEQPVLLMPSGGTRPVHVGELLPACRQRWPLSLMRLPVIPKRAILAAGVCAGLAAPGLARHLATRMILGRPAGRAEGFLEVTRIVYTGPLTPRAASAIRNVLEAGRR